MKAGYQTDWNAREKATELLATAKAENRDITAEENRAIFAAGDCRMPAAYYGAAYDGIEEPYQEKELKIVRIELDGDRAVVHYETIYAVIDAYYIKIDNQWYIYDIIPIRTLW